MTFEQQLTQDMKETLENSNSISIGRHLYCFQKEAIKSVSLKYIQDGVDLIDDEFKSSKTVAQMHLELDNNKFGFDLQDKLEAEVQWIQINHTLYKVSYKESPNRQKTQVTIEDDVTTISVTDFTEGSY